MLAFYVKNSGKYVITQKQLFDSLEGNSQSHENGNSFYYGMSYGDCIF